MKHPAHIVEQACNLLSAGASGQHINDAAGSLDVDASAKELADRAYYEAPTPRWMVKDPACDYEEWCALAESALRCGWRPGGKP